MASDLPESRAYKMWKPELYKIQLEAPSPRVIPCITLEPSPMFGAEYHGVLSHKEAALILEDLPNGSYLVRKGSEMNEFYTMSWRFNDTIHHYKLYYDGRYYVKEKRYSSMHDLVADGLVCLHMEMHAGHITGLMHATAAYQESPYVTLNRRRLKALSERSKEKRASKALLLEEPVPDCPELTLQPLKISIPAPEAKPEQNGTEQLGVEQTGPLGGRYSKPHAFRLHTFKGLNWCEFCANFLWGFTAQGVKCEDCGFIAHSKCSKHVPNHCMPDLKKLRGVFGIDLTTLLNAHASTLPFVVRKCVTEIELRGMEQEGIYRISGFADEIEALKLALDKDGEAANLSEYSNINVVAGCLKLYLRLLPVPLLTHQLHDKLVNSTYLKSSLEQISTLREVLTSLPPAHYNTLQYMMQHLNKVSLLASVNKMPPHNLSTVFAPTLMAMPPQCTDLSQEINVLEILITHYAKIFGM